MSTTSSPKRRHLPREERERRVLDAAADLFYARGVHEVGMDELIAATGLGKATVYRLYPSKPELLRAYLERVESTNLGLIEQAIDAHPDRPGDALRAILRGAWAAVRCDTFRGCAFNNASIEFEDPAHPARVVARRYRKELRRRLRRLARQLGRMELGDELAILIDGIYTNAAHLGSNGPSTAGYRLALELVSRAEEASR